MSDNKGETLPPLVKVIPQERYFARRPDGRFDTEAPLTERAAIDYLIALGTFGETRAELDSKFKLANTPNVPDVCMAVMGLECAPCAPVLLPRADGLYSLNTWVPPTVYPMPGPHPRVDRVLRFLTGGDAAGQRWLENWLAVKLASPGLLICTAVLLQGSQGSGKNVLYRMLATLLGPANCTQIGEADLSKPFNSHYARALLVLINELAPDHTRSFSLADQLKSMITDSDLKIEAKGLNRLATTNRMAIIAATNKTKPLDLEASDRRWSVFCNKTNPNDPSTIEEGLTQRQFLASLHVKGRADTFTAEFEAEISGFAHALFMRGFDIMAARDPYENKSRAELKALGEPPAEQFLRELREVAAAEAEGTPSSRLSGMLARLAKRSALSGPVGDPLNEIRGKSEAGADLAGCLSETLYGAFRAFCEQNGIDRVPTQRTLSIALSESKAWISIRVTAGNMKGRKAWAPNLETAAKVSE